MFSRHCHPLRSSRPSGARMLLLLLAAAAGSSSTTLAFSIVGMDHAHAAVQHLQILPAVAHHQHTMMIASKAMHAPAELWTAYQHQLTVAHPLLTKMLTGGTLAVAGDAIAQSKKKSDNNNNINNSDYDVRRAGSFAVFDMAYRALQHHAFPVLVQHCRGTVLTGVVTAVSMAAGQSSPPDAAQVHAAATAAALEQTLASQLIIVPFFYYPVFFTLTGFLQGLDARESWQRARDHFGPLMQRNLLFWIPVQYVQFALVPTDWQIPFLSCAGLAWTVLLSLTAGSAQTYATTTSAAAAAAAAVADDSEQQQQQLLEQSKLMMTAEQEEMMIHMAATPDDNAVSLNAPRDLVGVGAAPAYSSVSSLR